MRVEYVDVESYSRYTAGLKQQLDNLRGEIKTLQQSLKMAHAQIYTLNRKVFPTCNCCGQRIPDPRILSSEVPKMPEPWPEAEQAGQAMNKEPHGASGQLR